jgi:translation initiation factor IF-2
MVPTSARTGDGMGSLIAMIIETCQTNLAKRISYTDELQATVMEVSYSFLFKTFVHAEIGQINYWFWNNN